jgi:hypothetical protein
MSGNYQQFINVLGYSSMPPGFAVLFALLILWSIVWKGIALWKAAQNNAKWWFIAMLVINSVGILEIVYIFFFSKKKGQTTQK